MTRHNKQVIISCWWFI